MTSGPYFGSADDGITAIVDPHIPADSLEDILVEATRTGSAYYLREWLACRISDIKDEAASAVLSYIIESSRPKLTAAQLSQACGLGLMCGLTDAELARRFGISKQAFCQGRDKLAQALGLRKTTAQRSREAKERMSLCGRRKIA